MSDSASDLESLRQESKSTVDPVKSFLSGGFGGIACVLVGHPFDLTYVSLAKPSLIPEMGDMC
jgi:solute carrier family 25 carnitine/acylcarnitine transporter 20/29